MYTALVPYLMDVVSFTLVIMCLTAGHSPRWLPEISIVSFNTTEFKANYSRSHGGDKLPIHDVYNLFMSNHCDGYQVNETSKVANWTCSKPSPGLTYFLPNKIMDEELNSTKTTPVVQLPTGQVVVHPTIDTDVQVFPETTDRKFENEYNRHLYIAYIFYIVGLVHCGLVLALGILAFKKGSRGFLLTIFTAPASLYWFISSALVTHVQCHVAREINSFDEPSGVHAAKGRGFLVMTWLAFGLIFASTGAWVVAAIVSWDYRKNRKNKDQKGSPQPPPTE